MPVDAFVNVSEVLVWNVHTPQCQTLSMLTHITTHNAIFDLTRPLHVQYYVPFGSMMVEKLESSSSSDQLIL